MNHSILEQEASIRAEYKQDIYAGTITALFYYTEYDSITNSLVTYKHDPQRNRITVDSVIPQTPLLDTERQEEPKSKLPVEKDQNELDVTKIMDLIRTKITTSVKEKSYKIEKLKQKLNTFLESKSEITDEKKRKQAVKIVLENLKIEVNSLYENVIETFKDERETVRKLGFIREKKRIIYAQIINKVLDVELYLEATKTDQKTKPFSIPIWFILEYLTRTQAKNRDEINNKNGSEKVVNINTARSILKRYGVNWRGKGDFKKDCPNHTMRACSWKELAYLNIVHGLLRDNSKQLLSETGQVSIESLFAIPYCEWDEETYYENIEAFMIDMRTPVEERTEYERIGINIIKRLINHNTRGTVPRLIDNFVWSV